MTQKELLYVEDAIGHEKTMIEMLNSTMESLEDEELQEYLDSEIKIHTKMEKELLKFMEDLVNE